MNKVYQIVDWKKMSLIPAYTRLAASLTGNIRLRKELFFLIYFKPWRAIARKLNSYFRSRQMKGYWNYVIVYFLSAAGQLIQFCVIKIC